MGEITEYWTAAERNTRNLPLSSTFLYNRLFSLALSLGFLALAYKLFRFETRGRAARKKEKLSRLEGAEAAPTAAGPLPQPAFGRSTGWATLSKRTRFEMAQVFKSPAFFVCCSWACSCAPPSPGCWARRAGPTPCRSRAT
jgi:hypothetical protein